MKRILPLVLSVSILAAPVVAGEVNVPGKSEPPPPPPACTENCTNTATVVDDTESTFDAITEALLLSLALIRL